MRKLYTTLRRRHDALLAAIVLLLAAVFACFSREFLTSSNLVSLLESYSVTAIMAAVSQYLVMTVLLQIGGDWVVAFLLSAVFGGILGVVNALLIYYLRALSVIVTISTLTFYFSVLLFVTRGVSIYNLPGWFTADLSFFGVPFPVMVAAAVLVATAFILSQLS